MNSMRRSIIHLLCAGILFFSISCQNADPEPLAIDPSQLQESLIRVNKTLAHEENLAIDRYIERRGLKMERSGTGLRYMIINPGNGIKAQVGMRVTVKYRIELLDGTFCYSSDSLGTNTFTVDQDQIENTLLEKKILQSLDHPFLVGMVFCFQTEERVYFVMPFLRGGELFQHLRKFRIFDEEK